MSMVVEAPAAIELLHLLRSIIGAKGTAASAAARRRHQSWRQRARVILGSNAFQTSA